MHHTHYALNLRPRRILSPSLLHSAAWLNSLARVLAFYKPPGTSSFASSSTTSTELTNEATSVLGARSMSTTDSYTFSFEISRPSYNVGQSIKPNAPKLERGSVLLYTAECLPPGEKI